MGRTDKPYINDKYEQLVRDYPDIFKKSDDVDFTVYDGWYYIIDTLLKLICSDLQRAKNRLNYSIENPAARMGADQATLESVVKIELENLPTIVDIKEKFGYLRIYLNTDSNTVRDYIAFAEAISGKTCQICGSPGSVRDRGWLQTLCDRCDTDD